MSLALLALFLLADPGPLPDGNALVRSLVGRQRQREEALDRYSYDVFEEKLELDGAGQVEERHSRRYQVYFVKGRPVRLLVAEDGIPLAAKQRAKEEARAQRAAEPAGPSRAEQWAEEKKRRNRLAALPAKRDKVMAAIEQAEARKREIEATWLREDYYATASAEAQKALADEEAALGPRVEALMAEWEALETELAELSKEPAPR